MLLVGHSILKIDRQIRVNSAPILTSASPLFRDVHHCQIQHLKQAVIRREDGLCFGYLAKLAVEAFYRIGRINQLSQFLWVFKIGAEICPVISPGGRNLRIFPIPFGRKGVQSIS